jgi:hypothetical protein
MSGWDVWALQINLKQLGPSTRDIPLDGSFGPATRQAVLLHQKNRNLVQDGIAGIATQTSICLTLSKKPEQAANLPIGLLRGLIEGESGFAIACFSPHPSDSGFDLGAFQDSITPGEVGNQQRYARAFNVPVLAVETAEKIRTQFDEYAKVVSHKRAWELAVLYHNWPSAAHNLAYIGRIYKNQSADEPQQWIISATGGRLQTARQWVESYIEKKFIYVTRFP